MTIIRRTITAIAVIFSAAIAQALNSDPDNGYTNFYIAMFGDNFAKISDKTGIPVDSLNSLNPFIDGQNLLEGSIIRLRTGEIRVPGLDNISMTDSISYRLRSSIYTGDNASTQKVVAMLPFGKSDNMTRQNMLATEFYKGLVLSVRKNRLMPEVPPMKIIAIDTYNRLDDAIEELKLLQPDKNTIIIPADNNDLITRLSEISQETDALILNILSIQNNAYIENPNIIQCNINQPLMYQHALMYIESELAGYTPVILIPKEGAKEKQGFVDMLVSSYKDKNIPVIEINYNKTLDASNLKKLPKDGKFLFIPLSGTEDVFKTFKSEVVKRIQNSENGEYKIFGYPDWMVYTGENAEALHNMNAVIYSRFFIDDDDIFTKEAFDDFKYWFGKQAYKSFPSQALLGYDTGDMILRMLRKKWFDTEIDKFANSAYTGRQSAFRFVSEDGSKGLINNALYLIEYLPGDTFMIKVY